MSEKYSVLLMRDDQHVKRFRIGQQWLRFGLCLLVTVFLVAAGGLYVGYDLWTKNKELIAETKRLDTELQEQLRKLARLEEYEKYLENNDPAQIQAMAAAENGDTEEDEPAGPLDLAELLASVDVDRADVQDFSLTRRDEGDGLNLSFDLHNSDTGTPLVGRLEVTILGGDGREVDSELQGDDLDFQIENFKTMEAAVIVPEGMQVESLFGLRLSIVDQDTGEVLYSKVYYPLGQLLTS